MLFNVVFGLRQVVLAVMLMAEQLHAGHEAFVEQVGKFSRKSGRGSLGGGARTFFELLGVDVAFDDTGKPWVMRIDFSPDMTVSPGAAVPADAAKTAVLADLMRLTGIAAAAAEPPPAAVLAGEFAPALQVSSQPTRVAASECDRASPNKSSPKTTLNRKMLFRKSQKMPIPHPRLASPINLGLTLS